VENCASVEKLPGKTCLNGTRCPIAFFFHVSQAIVKASERRSEQLGDNLLDEMRRVRRIRPAAR
jgi:hypothetical protein